MEETNFSDDQRHEMILHGKLFVLNLLNKFIQNWFCREYFNSSAKQHHSNETKNVCCKLPARFLSQYFIIRINRSWFKPKFSLTSFHSVLFLFRNLAS